MAGSPITKAWHEKRYGKGPEKKEPRSIRGKMQFIHERVHGTPETQNQFMVYKDKHGTEDDDMKGD